jgi:hypothetical protein
MIKLKFKVDSKELEEDTYVDNPVRIKICDPKALLSKGLLGDSGIRMAEAGLTFIFERDLANELITEGIAKRVFECSDL